ncbi:PilZ domain-containing protein [Methylobacterium sp. J-070]|uniref:PilZ domain-containing protein n=1 Tax=Methylobacterium sp. J-070 TaxID=2836650 RepID=UPI001FB8716B|nr:PilZ domain-containing protein [Methylobacterium sp. J-070]MCJ2052456.1 PilZ domain-containing protein [Methylobacterium sp. J-070]
MSHSGRHSGAIVERRAAERKPTALLAFAQHPNGTRFPCQVKNISDRGAMLEFLGSHALMLETVFDLVLANPEMRYAVKLVWLKDRTAGVVFCSQAE